MRQKIARQFIDLNVRAAASALVIGLLVACQGKLGINLWDEGFLWNGSQRVLLGEFPICDLISYDPDRYCWSAALMSIFGDNVSDLDVSTSQTVRHIAIDIPDWRPRRLRTDIAGRYFGESKRTRYRRPLLLSISGAPLHPLCLFARRPGAPFPGFFSHCWWVASCCWQEVWRGSSGRLRSHQASPIFGISIFHAGWNCYVSKQCVNVNVPESSFQIASGTACDISLLRQLADHYAPNGQSFIVTPLFLM